jgi:hypothetical protein
MLGKYVAGKRYLSGSIWSGDNNAAWLPASLIALLCTIDKNQYKSSITDHFARSTVIRKNSISARWRPEILVV